MPHAFESVHNFDCLLFNFECFVKLPNDFELFPGRELRQNRLASLEPHKQT